MPYSVGIQYYGDQDKAAQVDLLSNKLLASQFKLLAEDSLIVCKHAKQIFCSENPLALLFLYSYYYTYYTCITDSIFFTCRASCCE